MELLFYSIIFLLIYLSYVLFVIMRKKKLKKFYNNTYVKYLENVYHLDIQTISIKGIVHVIALANASIITFTLWAIGITNHLLIKMIFAIVILIPFQMLVYHIIGKCYQRKHRKRG